MADDEEDQAPPAEVVYLWNCVKKALEANKNPKPREIDRLAAVAGEKLAATTIDGWFKTWSVVPTWDRFNALIKALAAEGDEDWKRLHEEARTADQRRKKVERERKNLNNEVQPSTQAGPMTTSARPSTREAVGENIQPCAPPPAGARAGGGSPDIPQVVWIVAGFVAATILVISGVILLFGMRGSSPDDSLTGTGPRSGSPVGRPVTEYCTYVVNDPVGVYSAPDIGAKRIKLKDLGQKITVSPRPSPPGWIAVRTPQDHPGFNWMPTMGLAPVAPC